MPQLEENFFHLERSWERLDQNGCSDGVRRNSKVGLREEEDVIPEPRFEVMLHLGKIKVGSEATLDEFVGIVKETETKIKDGGRDGSVVDGHASFIQMPAPRSVTP